MILFGLPAAGSDDAARAIRCCVGLYRTTARWIASLPPAARERIDFKIGAHFGMLVASRLGGGSYQHITATGDTVNVASRLMEVAAQARVRLALSDALLREAGRETGALATGSLEGPAEWAIRGRSGTVAVWFWRDGSETAHQGARSDAAS